MVHKDSPFAFGDRSLKHLETMHPDLQKVFREAIKYVDFAITDGHRGEALQNEAFTKGLSKLRYPHSKHNKTPSLAGDIVPWPVDWKNHSRFHYVCGVIMGIAAAMKERGEITSTIRWGGDWDRNANPKDESFVDLPHFEIV